MDTMAKEWSPFDWDEDKQQPRGFDECAVCAAILGIAVSIVVLKKLLGASIIVAVIGGCFLGLPLQWLFMIFGFPVVAAVVRTVWFLCRRENDAK